MKEMEGKLRKKPLKQSHASYENDLKTENYESMHGNSLYYYITLIAMCIKMITKWLFHQVSHTKSFLLNYVTGKSSDQFFIWIVMVNKRAWLIHGCGHRVIGLAFPWSWGLGAKMTLNWTKMPLHKQIKSITSVANKVKMYRQCRLWH